MASGIVTKVGKPEARISLRSRFIGAAWPEFRVDYAKQAAADAATFVAGSSIVLPSRGCGWNEKVRRVTGLCQAHCTKSSPVDELGRLVSTAEEAGAGGPRKLDSRTYFRCRLA